VDHLHSQDGCYTGLNITPSNTQKKKNNPLLKRDSLTAVHKPALISLTGTELLGQSKEQARLSKRKNEKLGKNSCFYLKEKRSNDKIE
jgi:hypothetical protein